MLASSSQSCVLFISFSLKFHVVGTIHIASSHVDSGAHGDTTHQYPTVTSGRVGPNTVTLLFWAPAISSCHSEMKAHGYAQGIIIRSPFGTRIGRVGEASNL